MKGLRGFQLLSAKRVLVVLNVGERDVALTEPEALGLRLGAGAKTVVVSAPIEAEFTVTKGPFARSELRCR